MKYCYTKKACIIHITIICLLIMFFVGLFWWTSSGNDKSPLSITTEQNQTVEKKQEVVDTSKLEQLLKEEETVTDRQNLDKKFIESHPGETLWNYLFIEKEYYNQFEQVKTPELISNEEIHYTIRGKNASNVDEVREIHLVLKEQKWEVIFDKVVES